MLTIIFLSNPAEHDRHCVFRRFCVQRVKPQWSPSTAGEKKGGSFTLSLAGAATSIIFVVCFCCLLWQNTSFVMTKVCLAWQNFSVCCEKHTFVMTMFCCNKYMFVMTKVSLLQQHFCDDKIMFVTTKVLLWQAYFHRNKRCAFFTTKMILVAAPANDITPSYIYIYINTSTTNVQLDWNGVQG